MPADGPDGEAGETPLVSAAGREAVADAAMGAPVRDGPLTSTALPHADGNTAAASASPSATLLHLWRESRLTA